MSSKQPKRKERPGVDRAGRTPLHYAASEGEIALARQLLESGIDPSVSDDQGWTPLHFAAQNNAFEIATLLLEKGAAVDPQDSFGNTPLFRAVFNSRGEGRLIKLLRERGADPNVKNNNGMTPLELARTIANFDVKQFFSDLPIEVDS